MKDNILPKGLVRPERLFDANDVSMNQKKVSQDGEMEDCNLGTQHEPKLIKMFRGVPKEYKERYVNIVK